jgi:5-methylcytosine-specific restriction endonuclease McrA
MRDPKVTKSIDFVLTNFVIPEIGRKATSLQIYSEALDQMFDVYVNSQRYILFKKKGCKCVVCGCSATHCELVTSGDINRAHFNFVCDDGTIMTKDHIIPFSLGGKNIMSNYQPMCQRCNNLKQNRIISIRDLKKELQVKNNKLTSKKALDKKALEALKRIHRLELPLDIIDHNILNKIVENKDTIVYESDLESLIPYNTLVEKLFTFVGRINFIDKFGIFGLPNLLSLEKIVTYAVEKKLNKIIDVGAGVGYISYGLKKVIDSRNLNIEVVAVDNNSFFHPDMQFRKWYPIQNIDALIYLKNVTGALIILCWPNYSNSFAFDIAKLTLPHNEMIYIGEGQHGCTADDDFFDNFKIKRMDIPWVAWWSIHDRVFSVGVKHES